MPSLETARRVNQIKWNNARTVGQTIKEQSDFAMESTWDNDPQSRVCYIYDYKHDDKPLLNKDCFLCLPLLIPGKLLLILQNPA